MKKVEYIDKEHMTMRCDGIDYPVMTAVLSVEEMQEVVDYSEKIANEILKNYEGERIA